MAGLEELRKKLAPLFDAEKGFSSGSSLDPSDSYMVGFCFKGKLGRKFEAVLLTYYLVCEVVRWWDC